MRNEDNQDRGVPRRAGDISVQETLTKVASSLSYSAARALFLTLRSRPGSMRIPSMDRATLRIARKANGNQEEGSRVRGCRWRLGWNKPMLDWVRPVQCHSRRYESLIAEGLFFFALQQSLLSLGPATWL